MLGPGGDTHSPSPQHPPVGTHRFVPGQFLKPLLHFTPHVGGEPLQTAAPFDGGALHELQPAPQ